LLRHALTLQWRQQSGALKLSPGESDGGRVLPWALLLVLSYRTCILQVMATSITSFPRMKQVCPLNGRV
jgi:hypothetical protein